VGEGSDRLQNSGFRNALILALVAACGLSGCARKSLPNQSTASSGDIDCMARAMYFESIRSSRDGMIAVGSVVMNRVQSDDFPNDVCAVVSQKNQFAPGLMTKTMSGQAKAQRRLRFCASCGGDARTCGVYDQ